MKNLKTKTKQSQIKTCKLPVSCTENIISKYHHIQFAGCLHCATQTLLLGSWQLELPLIQHYKCQNTLTIINNDEAQLIQPLCLPAASMHTPDSLHMAPPPTFSDQNSTIPFVQTLLSWQMKPLNHFSFNEICKNIKSLNTCK